MLIQKRKNNFHATFYLAKKLGRGTREPFFPAREPPHLLPWANQVSIGVCSMGVSPKTKLALFFLPNPLSSGAAKGPGYPVFFTARTDHLGRGQLTRGGGWVYMNYIHGKLSPLGCMLITTHCLILISFLQRLRYCEFLVFRVFFFFKKPVFLCGPVLFLPEWIL